MSVFLKLFLALVLIALNGFFVAAEFAMIRVRRTRVEELANEGNNASKLVLKALDRLDIFLAATQLGITIVTLSLGAFAEPEAERLLVPIFTNLHIHSHTLITTASYVISIIVITIVEVVFGELLPKWTVLDNPERAANFASYPMDIFVRVFYPLIQFLRWMASIFAKLIGLNPAAVGAMESAHSEDEIIAIVEQAEQEGKIGSNEAEIVDAAFEFGRTQAHEIMTPRVDIIALEVEMNAKAAHTLANDSSLTRLPVYEEDKDHILGVVHLKDLAKLAQNSPKSNLLSIVRQVPIVPETKRIDELLKEMQRSKSHMAIVMDEYGGTAGLVTIEDIVEELVGEIQDEYDRPAPVVHHDDGTVEISGSEALSSLEELGIETEADGEYETVGGFARHVLGLAATNGARTVFSGYKITVTEAHAHRIHRLLFEPVVVESEDVSETKPDG